MAALFRLSSKCNFQRIFFNEIRNHRAITTSQKNSETATATEFIKEVDAKKKNWVTYGFSFTDEAEDRRVANGTLFLTITLCIVVGSFVWSYLPDTQLRSWAQREAFLQLRKRENEGLDLISPNYVDPSEMILPSDEELGDTEIII